MIRCQITRNYTKLVKPWVLLLLSTKTSFTVISRMEEESVISRKWLGIDSLMLASSCFHRVCPRDHGFIPPRDQTFMSRCSYPHWYWRFKSSQWNCVPKNIKVINLSSNLTGKQDPWHSSVRNDSSSTRRARTLVEFQGKHRREEHRSRFGKIDRSRKPAWKRSTRRPTVVSHLPVYTVEISTQKGSESARHLTWVGSTPPPKKKNRHLHKPEQRIPNSNNQQKKT